MKAITTCCLLMIGLLATLSAQKIHLVPSASDSSRMDTIVISHMATDEDSYNSDEDSARTYTFTSTFDSNGFKGVNGRNIIPLVAIIFTFGFPIIIVALVLWFKYKNRQAKYKLISEALAAGQPLPKNFLGEIEATANDDFYERNNKLKNKGIQSIFQGIGLGIFLWLLTDSIGLAAVGLMLFCMGVGQVVMAYTNINKREQQPNKEANPENQEQSNE